MITAQFEMLDKNIEKLGTNFDDVNPTQQSHSRALRENNSSLNLCLMEHRMILEFSSY